jgi:hypothetical protein
MNSAHPYMDSAHRFGGRRVLLAVPRIDPGGRRVLIYAQRILTDDRPVLLAISRIRLGG